MTAFDTAWDLLKMPFVDWEDMPEKAKQGDIWSYGRNSQEGEYWVDDLKNPKAWAKANIYPSKPHRPEQMDMHFFEVDEPHRNKRYGQKALAQLMVEQMERNKQGLFPDIQARGVVPKAKAFWERMMDEGLIVGYDE